MAQFDEVLNSVYSSTVSEAAVLVREVRVRIGVLSEFVTIRIYYDSKRSEPYVFETSAVMKTATDRGSRDAPRVANSEIEALRRAVRMLTEDYEEAVRRGQLPQDAWLVSEDR